MGGSGVKVSVAGSHSSGTSTELLSDQGWPKVWPPRMSTWPLGSTTPLLKMREYAMGATLRTDTPAFMSIT
jgi:hypothetical protein